MGRNDFDFRQILFYAMLAALVKQQRVYCED